MFVSSSGLEAIAARRLLLLDLMKGQSPTTDILASLVRRLQAGAVQASGCWINPGENDLADWFQRHQGFGQNPLFGTVTTGSAGRTIFVVFLRISAGIRWDPPDSIFSLLVCF